MHNTIHPTSTFLIIYGQSKVGFLFEILLWAGQPSTMPQTKRNQATNKMSCRLSRRFPFWFSELIVTFVMPRYYSTNEYPLHVNLCLLWLQIRWCSLGDALLTWGWPTVWLGCLGLCRTPWVIEFIMLIVPVVLIKMVWSVCSSGLVVVVGLRWVVIRTAVSVLGYRSSIADVRWGWRRVIVKKMWRGGQTITLSTCDLEGRSLGCVA